ncbi:MAG TPA: NAD(P)/FAD-dependent oxidoreductase [Vicinamibacterales bacterium]|nr:NAD(P)/FAD-dependent oxidoreductase [Vicinamibacterales bacterium]
MTSGTAFDAIVVGGGPAGSSCAGALVSAGLRVLIVDAARFPRDKTCAGWITLPVVDLLDLDLAEYSRTRVCQPITAFRTGRIGSALRDTRFDDVVSYGICRVEFDHYLLRRSGANVVDGIPVSSLRYDRGMWLVNGTFTAPMLVGAGGHRCPVASHLGARPSQELAVAAQEVEFTLTPAQAARCRVEAGTPELSLCADLKGYGWCILKGNCLNVGLGRLDPNHLPAHVREFRRALVDGGIVPPDTPERWRGHAYLLRDVSPRRVVDSGAVLVGDAAGLAIAISGEGIRPAIESGLAAARYILSADRRYDRARLEPYAEWLEKRYPQGRHAALERLPEALIKRVISGLLETSWFTRRVLLERWFLQAA